MTRVIVLGGGVAGMSVAHELVERGFQVTVYEKKAIPGGKARSVPVPGSGERPLPGEHGFRFFPSFYRHITDTMKRIPYPGNRNGVFDNLVSTTRIEITQFGKPGVLMLAQFPRSLEELKILLQSIAGLRDAIGLQAGDLEYFASRMWQYLTSCQVRRLDDFEKISWWEFLGAATRSPAYQKFLAEGLTRSLVAARAELASAKVEGDVGVQLMLGLSEPGVNADRVLNGPTNDVWIDPWLLYLRGRGVDYRLNTVIDTIHCDGTAITGVTLQDADGHTFDDSADHYVLAVPVEVAARLFRESKHATIVQADPALRGVIELATQVAWMNGIQFYLREDVPMTNGHVIYVDSPWALTSISQHQFWPRYDLRRHGDGEVNGILSVDISDWNTPGILYGKPARECSRHEIKDEVWAQIKESVNLPGQRPVLEDSNLHSWFLDPDIEGDPDRTKPHEYVDAEPLLIDVVDSWHLRPDAYTRIPNFFLAADYIRTNTQLATMEAANEAARRAVNCIISASGVRAAPCKIWPLHEPYILSLWRWYDQRRYQRGEAWAPEFPWLIRAAQHLLITGYQLWHDLTGERKRLTRPRPALVGMAAREFFSSLLAG